jgi:hypothetical protein
MKTRLLAAALFSLVCGSLAAQEPAAAPVHATTITRSSIKIGNGSFALTKGTKLEVVGREGDLLVVKFRTSLGKIPLAETDFDPATVLPEAAAAAAPAKAGPAKPLPAVAKPAPATPAAPATVPALNTSGTGQQPATTYGKAVQKAKQVTETQKSTRVDPTKDIMDEEPKK